MQNQDSEQHRLIHEAMQNVAPVPISIGEKPDELKFFKLEDEKDKEHVFQDMRIDSVARNLGNTVLGLQNRIDTDELTEAWSKSKGHERMQEIIGSGHKLEIFYLDFNNFSEVNNTLGHDVGDTTLIRLAASLIGSLREGETLHRFGGDEFVIVKDSSVISDRRTKNKSVKQDQRVDSGRRKSETDSELEGLRKRFSDAFYGGVEALEDILGKELGEKMGLSIGHAAHKKGQTIHDLLVEADLNMYKDKQEQVRELQTKQVVSA